MNDSVYNQKTNKSYQIPSETRNELFRKKSNNSNNNVLTAQELFDEFYDKDLNCSVYSMQNFNIGDTIFVEDKIIELKYNEDNDSTKLYFGKTTEGPFKWIFAGDLRGKIKVGDSIKFKFKVVEEFANEEYTFETLDYFNDWHMLKLENRIPDISKYIIK